MKLSAWKCACLEEFKPLRTYERHSFLSRNQVIRMCYIVSCQVWGFYKRVQMSGFYDVWTLDLESNISPILLRIPALELSLGLRQRGDNTNNRNRLWWKSCKLVKPFCTNDFRWENYVIPRLRHIVFQRMSCLSNVHHRAYDWQSFQNKILACK